jgi:hypothetical protein
LKFNVDLLQKKLDNFEKDKEENLSKTRPGTSDALLHLNNQILEAQLDVSGIEIDIHDQSGQQVCLINKTNNEINMSGWKLLRKANESKCEYVFGKNFAIKANQHLRVWSSGASILKTPNDLVMDSDQKWNVSDAMITVLFDTEKKVINSIHNCIFYQIFFKEIPQKYFKNNMLYIFLERIYQWQSTGVQIIAFYCIILALTNKIKNIF